jgi:uncharacterized protein YjgD (DUF1641 family)
MMATTTASAVAAAPPPGGDADLRQELKSLHQKLDRLAEQVGYLHGRTRVVDEFSSELMPLAKDGMAALTEELEKLQHEFNTDELVHLLRRTLQSTPRFVWMLDQMESLSALVEEFTPIARELMTSGIEWLDQAERKGYFRLAKGAAAMADQIGEHFDQRDIDALAANFALMLETAKKATQPAMLGLAGSAVGALEGLDRRPPTPLSPWGLFKAMGDPDVQQGMGMLMEVLRRIARQATSPAPGLPPAKTNGAPPQLGAR